MKLQTKPTSWTCLATSFAMALNMPVADLFDEVGHDGSQILYTDLPDPAARKGHHIQECIDVCLWHLKTVTPVEFIPQTQPPCGKLEYPVYFGDISGNARRFAAWLDTSSGIITGRGRQYGHAVAYHFGQIFDPDGEVYDYSLEACEQRGFYTQCLWWVR